MPLSVAVMAEALFPVLPILVVLTCVLTAAPAPFTCQGGQEPLWDNAGVDVEDVEVGVRYRVAFSDCCVSGNFESEVTAKNYAPDLPGHEPYLETVTFANGVTLDTSVGGQAVEAESA